MSVEFLDDDGVKLPVFKTIKTSFKVYFKNYLPLLRLVGAWILLDFLCDALFGFPSLCEKGGLDSVCPSKTGSATIPSIVANICYIASMCAFYRYMLAGNKEKYSGKFGKAELKFIGYALLMLLAVIAIIMVPVLISVMLKYSSPIEHVWEGQVVIIFALLSLFAIIYIQQRVMLVFPAAAILRPSFSMKKSWKMTRGNVFRIFAVTSLSQIVVAIVSFVLVFVSIIVAAKLANTFVFYLIVILTKVVVISILMLSTVVNSAIYDFFMYHRGAVAAIPKDITDLAVGSKTTKETSSFVPLLNGKDDDAKDEEDMLEVEEDTKE